MSTGKGEGGTQNVLWTECIIQGNVVLGLAVLFTADFEIVQFSEPSTSIGGKK